MTLLRGWYHLYTGLPHIIAVLTKRNTESLNIVRSYSKEMSRHSRDAGSAVPCRRLGGCPGEDMYGTPEHQYLCSQCWKEVQRMEEESSSKVRTMVDEGHYQAPRLKTAGEMRITRTSAADVDRSQEREEESFYVNCRPWSRNYEVESPLPPAVPDFEICAQPSCRRRAGRNVEKFCKECHRNYVEIFRPHRQFTNDL